MPDYSQTKIYKLMEKDKIIYVGHTTEKYLSERLFNHRSDYARWKKGLDGKNLSWFRNDIDPYLINIVLLEDYPCENVGQARAREFYWKNELNMTDGNIPTPFFVDGNNIKNYKEWKNEWTKLNKEKISIQQKEFYLKNKERILSEHSKKIPCDRCGKILTSSNMPRHKRTISCLNHLKQNQQITNING